MHQVIPESVIRKIMFDLVKGLASVHSHGLIHRNISTSNVYVKDSTFKLGDFSSCRPLKHSDALTEYVYERNYRPPEVIMKIGYGKAADVFNLGCVMIELYNGRPPFTASDTDISHISQLTKLVGTK